MFLNPQSEISNPIAERGFRIADLHSTTANETVAMFLNLQSEISNPQSI